MEGEGRMRQAQHGGTRRNMRARGTAQQAQRAQRALALMTNTRPKPRSASARATALDELPLRSSSSTLELLERRLRAAICVVGE